MKRIIHPVVALMMATPLAAHPHVFVDTGLEMIFNDTGQLTHVQVTWQYDALYSLLITEDMGLDPDYDGVLTTAEQAALTGFDMKWVEGFNGDLEVLNGAEVLALSGPSKTTAVFAEGRITTTHLREILSPVSVVEQVVIKPYDPTYYTAYDVTLPVVIRGSDTCRARVKMPDINADLTEIRDQLSTLDPDAEPQDAGLPNIGAELANDVIVTCAGS
ncbi:DUF1007 family protein [Sulfitobacter sp. SK011]|uniref:DUF1007 family protein n=1 Tax=Sulfitobacter sp. SK011 TaxID=1389004 RepID=UPI000E0B501D|nr:DUF1007 family protein [Sulfitobacter sp. SK011]AXI40871.1 DUF1007 domain-containing protein [Sulfitobacter sp. SK011]